MIKKENGRKAIVFSLHRQGVEGGILDTDPYINAAITALGGDFNKFQSPWQKGAYLSELVIKVNGIVVIDGIDSAQRLNIRTDERSLDQALLSFVRALTAGNSGCCIVTSRFPIQEISAHEGNASRHLAVDGLSVVDGRCLLRKVGVIGSDRELDSVCSYFKGHCLCLRLAARFLVKVNGGRARSFREKHYPDIWSQEHEWIQTLMETYAATLGKDCVEVLHLISLFDGPTSFWLISRMRSFARSETIEVQLLEDAVLRIIVSRLIESEILIIGGAEGDMVLDVHPLVRNYFRRQFIVDSHDLWISLNSFLADYYASKISSCNRAYSDISIACDALMYAVRAERYEWAIQYCYKGVLVGEDGEDYAAAHGALSAVVSCLSMFFSPGSWSALIHGIPENLERYIYHEASKSLTAMYGYSAPETAECYDVSALLPAKQEQLYFHYAALLGRMRSLRLSAKISESNEEAFRLLKILPDNEYDVRCAVFRTLASNYFYGSEFLESARYAELGWTAKVNGDGWRYRASLDVNEPQLSSLGYRALSRWFLGRYQESIDDALQAVTLAESRGHAHTLVILYLVAAMVHNFCGDRESTKHFAMKMIRLCDQQGFHLWKIAGEILFSWSSSSAFSKDEANLLLDGWRGLNATLFTPYWCLLFADKACGCNDAAVAMEFVESGLSISARTGEKWCDPLLLCIKAISSAKLCHELVDASKLDRIMTDAEMKSHHGTRNWIDRVVRANGVAKL